MNNLSVLFPVDKEGNRKEYLEWAFNRYRTMLPLAEIIIGEDNSNYPYFARSVAINNAAKQATKPILLIMDIDIIITLEQIKDGVNMCQQDTIGIATSNNCYARLKQDISEQILNNKIDVNTQQWTNNKFENVINTNKGYRTGGTQFITINNFNLVDGYDERFYGYGDEDIAFGIAVDMLCGRMYRSNKMNLHIWHPRQPSYQLFHNNETINKKLSKEYRQLKKDNDIQGLKKLIEMRGYCESS